MEHNTTVLLEKIAQLEKENERLQRLAFPFVAKGKTVNVPEDIRPLFDQAEKIVGDYFKDINAYPQEGSIEINGERYVLMRASSLSVDFLNKIKNLYADKGEKEAVLIGRKFLFDIAHVLGSADAKNFHGKMNVTDPIAKLSAGPVHFAYSGWAFVDILPESNPSPDDNFFLKYHHPYSFEADSWIAKGEKSEVPVCIMNSGYSSGWCAESFGLPLTAVEIKCRAKGDDKCTFIMAPPHKIEDYLTEKSIDNKMQVDYEIPLFFERKKAEDKIVQSLKEKDILIREVHHRVKNNLQIISSFLNLQSYYLPDTLSKEVFSKTMNRVKSIALVHEKLQQSDDVQKVDIEQYILSIIDLLRASFNNVGIRITTEVSFDQMNHFSIDRAIPCGLIINELVSNAIKHGVSEDNSVKIHVVFTESTEGYTLIVKDSGKGIKSDFDIKESKSLGLEIVMALVEQLGGSLKTDVCEGTSFIIQFPK